MYILVLKGLTRQGLHYCVLNIFYQDLIDILTCTTEGILINDVPFNVFCYTNDLLSTSTSAIGLLTLIDKYEYIVSHGIRFYPTKN